MTPACVVLDAMGVMFAAADDVEELLIPFVTSINGAADARQIRSAYLDASLGAIGADEFWTSVGLSPAVEDDYLTRHTLVHGVVPFLRTAKAAGVPVWCLSNDVARWSAKLRASFGLDRQKNVQAARALGIASIEFDAQTGFSDLAARIFGIERGSS